MKEKVKKIVTAIRTFIDKHFEVFYFILFIIAAAICTVVVKHKCLLLYNWQCVLVGLFSASPFYIVPLAGKLTDDEFYSVVKDKVAEYDAFWKPCIVLYVERVGS